MSTLRCMLAGLVTLALAVPAMAQPRDGGRPHAARRGPPRSSRGGSRNFATGRAVRPSSSCSM